MRANYLKIFMFLCAFLIVRNSVLNAQEKQVEIRWSAPVNVATTEKPLMVPSFEKAHFSYSVSEGFDITHSESQLSNNPDYQGVVILFWIQEIFINFT